MALRPDRPVAVTTMIGLSGIGDADRRALIWAGVVCPARASGTVTPVALIERLSATGRSVLAPTKPGID